LRVAICVFLSLFLVGCGTSVPTAVIPTSPATQTPLPAVVTAEPVLTPTATAAATGPDLPISSDAGELLESAVANLTSATSFRMAAHEIRAYQIIEPSGATTMVYGEFHTEYAVIRLPTLKVHTSYKYRYDPRADFEEYESYMCQENGRYFTRLVEDSIVSDVEEIDLQQLEPLAGDVYQTLVTYSDQAEFVTESNGMAVYVLEHPEWYRLKGAIGFADLGFLYGQENGEQLVRQYVEEHYPNVKTLRFTLHVAVNEKVVARVVIDDKDFMASIWAEVDRALVERGENPNNLARYEVMSVNGAEYLFSDYDHVQDFKIP
jgi:hypothetical protein